MTLETIFIKDDELKYSNGFVEISRVVLKVNDDDKGVTFITTYMPGDTPLSKFKEAVNAIEAFMDANPNSKCVLSGDMNLSSDTVIYYMDEEENLFSVIHSGRDGINSMQYQKERGPRSFLIWLIKEI